MANQGIDSSNRESNNITRYEYGLFDSNRRVLDGHTKPCEEFGAVDWQLDDSRGKLFVIRVDWLSKKTSLTQVLNGLIETSPKIALELVNR